MKAIDSNLLVYASLADHPSMAVCEQYIGGHAVWITNVVNLVEVWRVLVAVYGVSEGDADEKFAELSAALVVEDFTAAMTSQALSLRQSCGIDFNDAVLLETCRQRGVTVLATDDTRLATACVTMGVNVENPVTPVVRAQMTNWELQNLPAKGLPRILLRVHRWIEQHDPALAAEFHAATQAMSRLA